MEQKFPLISLRLAMGSLGESLNTQFLGFTFSLL